MRLSLDASALSAVGEVEDAAPAPDLRLVAPAKVNLFLRVVGKRPDGFHELASLFQTVSLFDDLDFEKPFLFSYVSVALCSSYLIRSGTRRACAPRSHAYSNLVDSSDIGRTRTQVSPMHQH